MSNLMAPFLSMDPPPARRARRRPESREEPWLAGPGDEVQNASPEQALDAEMLGVVQKFETAYAELAPPVEDEPCDSAPADDLFIEFPDELRKPATGVRAVSDAPKPRMPFTRGGEPAPHEPEPRQTRTDQNDQLNVDEAFSILRAAEAKGKAAAERAEREPARAVDAEERAPLHMREDVTPPHGASSAPELPVYETAPTAPRSEGSTQSQTMWPSILIAALLALAIGTAVGYVMSRNPDTAASGATVQVTGQGATQLLVDYDLRTR